MGSPDLYGVNATGTVVIVDDDSIVRETLEEMLREAGLEVRSFPSAGDFLSSGPLSRPACLVLDLLLPDQDGLQLQQKLAADGLGVPIIFLTGHGDVESSVQAMKAGAVDFFRKPYNVTQLVASIRLALAHDLTILEDAAEHAALTGRYRSLTARQRQVFELVVAGLTNREAAGRMGVTEKTVKAHRGQVMSKMEAGSVADLVRMASKLGLEADN